MLGPLPAWGCGSRGWLAALAWLAIVSRSSAAGAEAAQKSGAGRPQDENASAPATKKMQEDPRELEAEQRKLAREHEEQRRRAEERARQQEREREEEERRREEKMMRKATGKRDWCGPDACYTQDGASCFETYRADYCMHLVYICTKNIFSGCRKQPSEYLAELGAEDDFLSSLPPPATRSASDWAALLGAALLAAGTMGSLVSRLFPARRWGRHSHSVPLLSQ